MALPKGGKRPADVISYAVKVLRIAVGDGPSPNAKRRKKILLRRWQQKDRWNPLDLSDKIM